MSLLTRRHTSSFGNTFVSEVDTDLPGLDDWWLRQEDPDSEHFAPPIGDKPAEIVRYMVALQQQKYGQTILDKGIGFPILSRQIKRLLGEYTADAVKRAIRRCSIWSRYPFSTKMVERLMKRGWGQ